MTREYVFFFFTGLLSGMHANIVTLCPYSNEAVKMRWIPCTVYAAELMRRNDRNATSSARVCYYHQPSEISASLFILQ